MQQDPEQLNTSGKRQRKSPETSLPFPDEPPDKPVKLYEDVLFLCLDVVMVGFLTTCWQGLYLAGFMLAIPVFVLSLFRLLLPPRWSANRAFFVFGSLLSLVLLLNHAGVCR